MQVIEDPANALLIASNICATLKEKNLDPKLVETIENFIAINLKDYTFLAEINFNIEDTSQSTSGQTPAYLQPWDQLRTQLLAKITLDLELFSDLDKLFRFVNINRRGTLNHIINLTGITLEEFKAKPIILALFIIFHEIGHLVHLRLYMMGEGKELADLNLADAIGIYQWEFYNKQLQQLERSSTDDNITKIIGNLRQEFIKQHGEIVTDADQEKFTKFLETKDVFATERAFKAITVEEKADEFAVKAIKDI